MTFARDAYDAIVVGSGPNGLAAATVLAQAGLSTLVVEARARPGGGVRSSELTLPGFVHDDCSAVHPLGCGSPYFRALPLADYGLAWIDSPAPVAHLFANGSAITLERSIADTAAQCGVSGDAYRRLMEPLAHHFHEIAQDILAPLGMPRHPLSMARFGVSAIQSMEGLARTWFDDPRPAALLAGIAAHAMIPLDRLATSAFGLVLAMAGHAVGWPIARGGSQAITNALVAHLRGLGGELVCNVQVDALDALPRARAYVLDTSVRDLVRIAGARLPARFTQRMLEFRYGPGVFKVDWALDAPVPWTNDACKRAVTVHLSGDLPQIAAAEAAVSGEGRVLREPFTLFGQPSIVDATRAPAGKGTAWAYCHVPNGSSIDALDRIEALVEKFAPGFRDTILGRHARNALQIQAYSANFVGGDINGGDSSLPQLFFRPRPALDPYATPAPDVFLCSSSSPPGGGVHGMCGYWAAKSVLRRVFAR